MVEICEICAAPQISDFFFMSHSCEVEVNGPSRRRMSRRRAKTRSQEYPKVGLAWTKAPAAIRADPLIGQCNLPFVRSRKWGRGPRFQELAVRARESNQPRKHSASSRTRQPALAASADSAGLRLHRALDASQQRSRQTFRPTNPSSALRSSAIFAASFSRPVAVSNASRNLGSENTPRISAP